jgi:hypothetical protein
MYTVLPNNINYFGPVLDPLFIASGVYTDTSNPSRTIYFGDNFITMLVCLDQVQYCNPLNSRCTAETHPMEAWNEGEKNLELFRHIHLTRESGP